MLSLMLSTYILEWKFTQRYIKAIHKNQGTLKIEGITTHKFVFTHN